MSGLEVASKACTKCEQVKPLSEFYRDRVKPDGRHSWCKECALDYQRRYIAEEITADPEGFRRRRNRSVDEHRRRTGNARGLQYGAARRAAVKALIEAHPDQFEALFRIAKYDRGLL